MKTDLFNHIMQVQMGRRKMMQGAAAVGLMAGAGGIGARPAAADAHGALRQEILKIPGVGMGSPSDADWQKVGELTLGQSRNWSPR